MARALTVSEANQHLLSLGYSRDNFIEDNEFTKDYGKSSYTISETTNSFDTKNEYRWWKVSDGGVRFVLNIHESYNGRSFLSISKCNYNGIYGSGSTIVNYAKLNAKDKKKFIEIFDELATRKQSYSLQQTNDKGTYVVWGNALPEKIIEF